RRDRRRRGGGPLPRRSSLSRRSPRLRVCRRTHLRREESPRLGIGHWRPRQGALRGRPRSERSDRHLLQRRRLRRLAHARRETLHGRLQRALRLQRRVPGLAEARSPGDEGREALSWLTHPWLTIRVQIGLGAIFIVASLPKIADPPSFAHMIYNYRLLPGPLVNGLALLMPWVELLAGLALILG